MEATINNCKYIFPKTDIKLVEIVEPKVGKNYKVQMYSLLRIKHEDKYYLTPYIRDYRCINYTNVCYAISMMFEELVNYQKSLVVDVDLKHYSGDYIFKLDENQDD